MAGFGRGCGMRNAQMAPRAYIHQMDVTGFAVFDTQIGTCGLAWGPQGLAAMRLPYVASKAMRLRLAESYPGVPESEPPPEIAGIVEDVRALLRGEPRTFEAVRLDYSEVSAFKRRVYEVALTIPPGETLTYGEIAERLGEPGAARAVGRALGENPFPPVVPCHRVLAAGGRKGGFSAPGGSDTKMRMLEIEGALRPETLPLFR
jgi:methylated-DNA-[protein]-cysteine S-methyltransferase